MPASPRDDELLDLLRPSGTGRIAALARRLGVSQETVRRGLKRLEAQGRVTRFHGGAGLREVGAEPSFAQRMRLHPEAKRAIGRSVAALVPDGSAVFLDIGSTTAFAALALQARRDLMVATNSLAVAHALAGRNGNRVFMAGGELRAHDGGAFGPEALAFLRQFRVARAILSAAALGPDGVFLHDLSEAEIGRAMAAQADEVVIVADRFKFSQEAPIRLFGWDRVTRLISDAAPPAPMLPVLATQGVAVVLA